MKAWWEMYKIGMIAITTGIACMITLFGAIAGAGWILHLVGVW